MLTILFVVSIIFNIVFSLIILIFFLLHFLKYLKSNNNVAKIFNKKELYEIIFQTAKYFSLNKIGAIITFERNVNLNNKISKSKSGVLINSILSSELLMTIFYPGTKLHDGAVIIKGNKIYMANVMFNNKITQNKFLLGARHRAALAISEVSDSVTLVVSEQTGIIRIFKNGSMKQVKINDFFDVFPIYME